MTTNQKIPIQSLSNIGSNLRKCEKDMTSALYLMKDIRDYRNQMDDEDISKSIMEAISHLEKWTGTV